MLTFGYATETRFPEPDELEALVLEALRSSGGFTTVASIARDLESGFVHGRHPFVALTRSRTADVRNVLERLVRRGAVAKSHDGRRLVSFGLPEAS